MTTKKNGDGRAGPLRPIPQHELDRLIEKAETQTREMQTNVRGNLGVISDDPDGLESGEAGAVPFLPRYSTPRAIPAQPSAPKSYCESCGHVDSHAHGCPVTRGEETVNIAELVEAERDAEPSIRRELKRIAVVLLKRVAERLER